MHRSIMLHDYGGRRKFSDGVYSRKGLCRCVISSGFTLAAALYLCDCRYRLAGLPGDYQEKNISSPETNYCLLKDLIIWTQYQIQVAAYTGAGLGVYSSPVTEYTLQGGE